MKTSPAGIAALEAREGKRFVAYQDSNGVWTIGVGHTGRMAPPTVYKGMTITKTECDAFLAADLAPVEKAINGLGAPLTQNQFDACASLGFNIGVAGFQRSSVASWIHKGDMAAAAAAFMLWDKPAVLKARREAERAQFLTPDDVPVPKTILTAAQGAHDALKAVASNHPVPASPLAAKPSPAPVAAAPASSSATTKEAPMTASTTKTAAAKPAAHIDIFAGITNLFNLVKTSVTSTATVAANGVTSSAVSAAVSGVEDVEGAIVGDHGAFVAAIDNFIGDIQAKKWGSAPADAEACLKAGFAILSHFGVNVPVVSAIVSALPSLPAVA